MPPKTLSKDFSDKWKHLLSELKVEDVPIEFIIRLELYFNNGDIPAFIDIRELLKRHKPDKLEKIINSELEQINDILDYVSFHIDITRVVSEVDSATDKALDKI